MSSTGRGDWDPLSLQVITQTLWLLRRYFKLQQESLLWRPRTRPHARMPLVVEEKFMIVNIIAWNVLINDLLNNHLNNPETFKNLKYFSPFSLRLLLRNGHYSR